MRLPNSEHAVVDIEKLQDYCLSSEHPRGRHKARVFSAVLGFSAADASELRDLLLDAARTRDATPTEQDAYGQRYTLDLKVGGPAGQATIRSSWIVRHDEGFPRLTSCYIL